MSARFHLVVELVRELPLLMPDPAEKPLLHSHEMQVIVCQLPLTHVYTMFTSPLGIAQ